MDGGGSFTACFDLTAFCAVPFFKLAFCAHACAHAIGIFARKQNTSFVFLSSALRHVTLNTFLPQTSFDPCMPSPSHVFASIFTFPTTYPSHHHHLPPPPTSSPTTALLNTYLAFPTTTTLPYPSSVLYMCIICLCIHAAYMRSYISYTFYGSILHTCRILLPCLLWIHWIFHHACMGGALHWGGHPI